MVSFEKKKITRKAFTLVELMIAATCLMLIIGPIFLLLRSGTNTSLRGMLRIETTLKARNVLQQVYADLKMACFKIPEEKAYSFDEIITEDQTSAPNYSYQFYSFPIHQKYSDIFENPEEGINNRIPSLITYRIEGESAPYKLIREEKFKDNKPTSKILSENVNFFEIKEIGITTAANNSQMQFYYLITLQLIDVLHASDYKDKNNLGQKLRENQKDIILADFYDVVYPEYFNALWNDKRLNQNWHTELKIDSE